MSGKIGIEDVFRVSKSGNKVYINIKKVADTFNLKKGDKIRVEIKEKVVTTYSD